MTETQSLNLKAQNFNSKVKIGIRERAYKYALQVIKFIDTLPKDQAGMIIGKQLLRSATSIGANIIEAKSASSRRDFINFYTHSLKSANESKFWLGLLRDSGKMADDNSPALLQETVEISNILAASILTLKAQSSKVKSQN